MYINQSQNQTYYNLSKPNLNFKAIHLARYQYGKSDFLNVYQLEKRDLPFISKFSKNLKQYFKDKQINDYSRQEVMKEAFSAAEKILNSPRSIKGKARIFLATKDSNPCGILIGNFDASDEDIIPMVATPEKIKIVKKYIGTILNREKLNNTSVSLDSLKMN